MYDFHKIRNDKNENEFKHRFFRLGYKYIIYKNKN